MLQSSNSDFLSGNATYSHTPGDYSWEGLRTTDWNMLLVVKGEGCKVVSNGKTLDLPRGSLTLIAPGYPRFFLKKRVIQIIWFHFQMNNNINTEPTWPERIPGFQQIQLPETEFRRVLRDLLEAHLLDDERPKGWFPLACGLIGNAFNRGNMITASEKDQEDSRIILAKKLLSDISVQTDMDAVAARCGMSRAMFYKHFKNAMGISPRQYREAYQLRKAQILLSISHHTLAEIAVAINMRDVYYLSKRFKKKYGISPSAYREREQAYPSYSSQN